MRRYNGLHGGHGGHKNLIEDQEVTGYHIHKASNRYQIAGHREDGYAVPSTAFSDVPGALRLMFAECGFKMPAPKTDNRDNQQMKLLPDK
ncbi:MAG TPA: hypothetical protein VEF03_10965 [Candidatus Binataceae bacterium]|nr:hypothetical protein [Candidatus Binataceae bacterium]